MEPRREATRSVLVKEEVRISKVYPKTWGGKPKGGRDGSDDKIEKLKAASGKVTQVNREAHARQKRTAAFMAQLISRPARHDRVLDLTYCAELTAADFAGRIGSHPCRDASPATVISGGQEVIIRCRGGSAGIDEALDETSLLGLEIGQD